MGKKKKKIYEDNIEERDYKKSEYVTEQWNILNKVVYWEHDIENKMYKIKWINLLEDETEEF